MKKLTSLTLLILLGTFLSNAQENPAPTKAKKPSLTNTSSESITGKLGYISDKKITVKAKGNTSSESITGKLGYISDKKITVKAKGAEASTTFLIDSETKITLNNEAKLFSDLKKGSVVTVTPKTENVATASLISLKEISATNAPAPVNKTEE